MYNVAGILKHKVAVYARRSYTDEGGCLAYRYEKIKDIWCDIKPIIGERSRAVKNDDMGDMIYSALTTKFTTRINSVEAQNDMYLMYKGQRYDVEYTVPYFKDMQYMEIYARLVTENDDNRLTREGLGF